MIDDPHEAEPAFADAETAGEFYVDRAERRMRARDFAGALADFKRALAELKDDPRAEFGITMAELALEDEARVASARERLKAVPEDTRAALQMADALRRNGRLGEALEALHEAVARAPKDPRVHYELALTLSCWSKDHAAALPHFDHALALKADFEQALRFRAIARRELGYHHQAIDDFSRLLDLAPDDRNVYENRALAFDGLGAFARAEADYDRVLTHKPDSDFYLTRRGLARLAQDKLGPAVADFDRALALRRDEARRWHDPADATAPGANPDPDALRGRGLARLKQGEAAAGRADLEAAVTVYREFGKETQAQEVLRRLADLPPPSDG